MNRRFWPLSGLLTLAALAAHSGSAVALDRHKPVQHAQKPHGAAGAGLVRPDVKPCSSNTPDRVASHPAKAGAVPMQLKGDTYPRSV